jgi:polyisoprenyl-phosphate glycosyltransferase
MKPISIVLPVYNEETVLPLFHAELRRVLDAERGYRFEIIYVLDRSSDSSFHVLREIAGGDSRVSVLHLSRRFGHQMSLVAGIDFSGGDAVIMMDCDLQHPPSVIPALLRAYEGGHDIVHAIRHYDASTSSLKRATSRLFYRLQNWLSAVEIEEGAADFRLISRKVAAVFKGNIREQNQFLRGLFRWVGFTSTTVEFVSQPRARGETKYRFRRLLSFSIQGITSFSKVPLRMATMLGCALSLVTVLYGLWSFVGFFFMRQLPAGYTSLIVAMMFLGGLQLLVLGVLGEYLGSIFEEVKNRPLYIVDEVVGARADRSGLTPSDAAVS